MSISWEVQQSSYHQRFFFLDGISKVYEKKENESCEWFHKPPILIMSEQEEQKMRPQWPSVLSLYLLIICHSCMESRGWWGEAEIGGRLHSLISFLIEVYADVTLLFPLNFPNYGRGMIYLYCFTTKTLNSCLSSVFKQLYSHQITTYLQYDTAHVSGKTWLESLRYLPCPRQWAFS